MSCINQGNNRHIEYIHRKREIIFWQRIVSPHMAGLARELAKRGHTVTYIAEYQTSSTRESIGWRVQELSPAILVVEPDVNRMIILAQETSPDAIHVCQGLRANGSIKHVQKELARLRRIQFAVMETVNDHGKLGIVKRLIYSFLCRRFFAHGTGVLAIGQRMPEWLSRRGCPSSKIIPFAYFLPNDPPGVVSDSCKSKPFRICFVGRLVKLKRVQDLLCAVQWLEEECPPWELWLVGDGPEREDLMAFARQHLSGHVYWLGIQPFSKVPKLLAQTDLLVLPSAYDGWGAVVSEALIVGTPVICSDRCGASAVVSESGFGGVYPVGDVSALYRLIHRELYGGAITIRQRSSLKKWAESLDARSGARYFEEVIVRILSGREPPSPPWLKN